MEPEGKQTKISIGYFALVCQDSDQEIIVFFLKAITQIPKHNGAIFLHFELGGKLMAADKSQLAGM